ncbi:AMIN domain-containing protein, partial [Erwinia amylovora]|uniref:AMIN domain-containing protein n=1 Tax=Erwinia amylovora TaxID=552 RepID=UPI0020C163B6
GAGARWLLSVRRTGMTASRHVVAIRIWPASPSSRLSIESNAPLKDKQFSLRSTDRVLVDIADIQHNLLFNDLVKLLREDDHNIKNV